jgi:glycosyltransferase involved in cell wall biosynthesis
MKVVIPVASLETGGGCKELVDTANALHDRGHESEIVIPGNAPITYNVRCKLTQVPKLSKEYIPYGDIVLPNFYPTFLPAFQAWPKQCVRFCQGFEPLWLQDNRFALWTYTQNVPIISISKWLDEQIYTYAHKKSTIVNPGIDRTIFYPHHTPKKPKKSNEPKTILYIARDPKLGYQVKGYDDFVKAMDIFNKMYNGNYIVHMVCAETILPLPGIPHLTFTPKSDLKKMAELYRKADVFVSTSWMEGFGFPPLEAMACGTPVVTTNSGGILDYCQHLKNAYIVPPKNPKRIASAIREVLTNKALSDSLITGGMEPAGRLTQQRFEDSIVKALEDIYRNRTT